MNQAFDVIVVGLGAMGSAAVYHLSRRGQRVLGLDRFHPPHPYGSSHGQTRIIREAYFEHPLYVPLVQRAYELWSALAEEVGRPLFRQTGGLMIGPPDGLLVPGARRSAELHGLPYQPLSAAELRERFPVFTPSGETAALWEPRAGILFPEACIEAHLAQARARGAVLRFEEPVQLWKAEGRGVQVRTSHGTYLGEHLLLCAGAWQVPLLQGIRPPLTVERQVLFWFRPRAEPQRFQPDRCPIFIWEHEPGRIFYGFPDLGEGVKVARHHEGEEVDPNTVRREVTSAEVRSMRALLRRHLPDAEGALLDTAVCLYTNTPDGHFLIDRHPACPRVWIVSPCSGHGFKFASVIGEILADLVIDGRARFDLSPFRLDRWGPPET